MNSLNVFKLKNGKTKLSFLPDYGGKISDLSFDGFDVFRPLSTESIKLLKSAKGGNFPLVPFSNRIKNSKFHFNNTLYKLDENKSVSPHSIHGHGYIGKWSIIDQTPSSALISYSHYPLKAGWPWAYEVKQEINLEKSSCSIRLSIINKSNSSMPIGFGFHPFFNFNDNVTLEFDAEREWIGLPESFPNKTQNIKNNFNVKNGANLWKIEKTVCYENFKGNIKINWIDQQKSVTIEVDKIFNHLIVHVPKGGDYFCIEPVSHPTDGFNLAYKKIENIKNRILLPNENISGLMKICFNN
jgi:aldose 1-epimerase